MTKNNCEKHGPHERRKCPACVWVNAHPSLVNFTSGCPRCGEQLAGNAFIMWCANDTCPMQSTSHAA